MNEHEMQRGGFRQRFRDVEMDDAAMQGAIGIVVVLGCALGLFGDDEPQPVYAVMKARFPAMSFGGSGQTITGISKGDPIAG